MATQFNPGAILHHLDELIKLQTETLVDCPEKAADDVSDWRAINYLFLVGREYPLLNFKARQRLDTIFQAWTSPEGMTLRGFMEELQTLRDVIAVSRHEVAGALEAETWPLSFLAGADAPIQ